MRDPSFAVFQRTREAGSARRQTELFRYQSTAPFGIVGFAGNVAEWVTYEPGSRRVLGTMGGSFKYPYTNEVNIPRLDREPTSLRLRRGNPRPVAGAGEVTP